MLPYFGAIPMKAVLVRDGNNKSLERITAGIESRA